MRRFRDSLSDLLREWARGKPLVFCRESIWMRMGTGVPGGSDNNDHYGSLTRTW